MNENKNRGWRIAETILLICIIGLVFLLKLSTDAALFKKEYNIFSDRGLARINIVLDGISLKEIDEGSKETKYEGNKLVLYKDKQIKVFNNVEIKGRGNTTWLKEKKPYQIKLSHNVDLLNTGKSKKWVLLANSLDSTHLRNDIAMMLAEMVGMEFNHRGEFIELYVDDEYRGLYYMIQKVEINKGSVDLKGEDGVLFELDMNHKGEKDYYVTYFGEHLVLSDSVKNDLDEEDKAITSFINDFNKAEKTIETKDYKKLIKILDIDSFAKYFLINEFAVNPDAYSTSFYLYKNKEGKIAAGPVWDFDLAFSNREWIWQVDDRLFSPYEDMIKKREAFGLDGLEEDLNISKIFYYLMDIPEFKEKVSLLFRNKLSGREEELIKAISDKKAFIDDAAIINNERWGKDDYEEEYMRLVEWIKARYSFFEEKYGR